MLTGERMIAREGARYWWLNLITGILLVLLAFWVSGSDRVYALAQRTYLILFWVGFLALFRASPRSSWPSPSATPDRRPQPSIRRAHADQRVLGRRPVAWPSAARWTLTN